jgi:hypothetical protein
MYCPPVRAGALAFAIGLLSLVPANAAPLFDQPTARSLPIQNAGYYGHGYGYGYHHRPYYWHYRRHYGYGYGRYHRYGYHHYGYNGYHHHGYNWRY